MMRDCHRPCCCGFERLFASGPQKANLDLILVESKELKKNIFLIYAADSVIAECTADIRPKTDSKMIIVRQ